MQTFFASVAALTLTAFSVQAHIGDSLSQLRVVYGATAKKQANSMIFERNGYSICVYFNGAFSGMEVFTRDGSVKSKPDISDDDVKGLLSMEGQGQGWSPVTSKSGKMTFLRADRKVIARVTDAADAVTGAPAKAFIVMVNDN